MLIAPKSNDELSQGNQYPADFVGPLGPNDWRGPPIGPPPTTVDDNIAEIVGLRGNTGTPFPHGVWLDKVRPGGDWDYKLQNPAPSYQDLGNFNYGATGRALGLSEDTLLRGAGVAQMLGGAYDTDFGTPLGGPPYGDDPRDQFGLADAASSSYRERREEYARSQIRHLERVVSSMFGRMQANRVFDAIQTGQGNESTVRWSAIAAGLVLDPAAHFSSGQRQDLAVALFLARARSLGGTFFLDEPIAHLDDLNRVAVLDTLRMIIAERRQSVNLVVTTASRALLRHMAEKFGRVSGVAHGRRALRIVELEGTPRTSVTIAESSDGCGPSPVEKRRWRNLPS